MSRTPTLFAAALLSVGSERSAIAAALKLYRHDDGAMLTHAEAREAVRAAREAWANRAVVYP